MHLDALYRRHLEQLDLWLDDALKHAASGGPEHGPKLDGVLFHAGGETFYDRDDRPVPFVPAQHFRRWAPPLAGPEHVVLARPGRPLLVVRVRPDDYWHDTSPPPASHWEDAVVLEEVQSLDEVSRITGRLHGVAYVGPSAEAAATLGIDAEAVNPPSLLAPLDWHRAAKTDYEVELLRLAARKAAAGHAAARDAFDDGATERQVYRAYLEAADAFDHGMPYGAIVAFDEKAAILHYQHKRDAGPRGTVLLLDAGAEEHGYAADITRTWWRDEAVPGGVDDTFKALVRGVDAFERDLVAMVAPGRPFAELHVEAHRRVAELLRELGVITASVDEAVDTRLTRLFFPHGLGHLLGLQVHDVGGHQQDVTGGVLEPPDEHVLRNTRTLEPGQVTTIEPGIYFIPMLLDPHRDGELSRHVDWRLVDRLIPYGGVRIEDDVLVTADGHEDLTRPLIEGPPAA